MNTKRPELQATQDRTVVVGRSDGHPWGDPVAVTGEFRWPPTGRFPWPPSLQAQHGLGIDAYGVMITLVTAPSRQLPIGTLGEQRNLSPSGISRSVDRLTKAGLVTRSTNPADGRSLLVGLTPDGLKRLREAQVTHHQVVRDRLLSRLDQRDLKRLGELWEKAMPGAVSSPTWPL